MSARSLAIDAYLLFGRLAVKYKHLSPEQLKKAIQQHEKAIKAGKTWQLGEVCVRLKLLTKAQCEAIIAKQQQAEIKNEGSYFGYLSLVNGFVNKEQLAKVLKEQKRIRKQGKEPPRLGELAIKHGLMTDGQVQAVLSAQMRLRDRLNKEADTTGEIATSGGIPVVGERAAEALKRLAEYEASLGSELEIEITSDDALEAVAPVDLPAPPREFTRTVSTDDIEVHFDVPSEQMFNSAATGAAEPVGAEPTAPVRSEEAPASTNDLVAGGLQLDDADEVEIAPVDGAIPTPPPPPAKAQPLEAEPVEVGGQAKPKKATAKPTPSEPHTQAAVHEPAEANVFAAVTDAAPAAKPVANSATPATTSAPKAGGTNSATAAQAAAGKAQHFRGRRSAAPGESAEFKPPPDRNRVTLYIILGVAGLIVAAYMVSSMLVSGM